LRTQQIFRSCSELERWLRMLQVYISPFAADPRRRRIAGATLPMCPNTRLTPLLPERPSALVLIESSLRRHPCVLSNKSIGFPFDSASLHCIQNTRQQVFKPQASPFPSHQRRYPPQQQQFQWGRRIWIRRECRGLVIVVYRFLGLCSSRDEDGRN